MLFAEITAEGWTVIIGAIFIGLTQLFNLWLTHSGNKTAERVEQKTDATNSTVKAVQQETKQQTELLETQSARLDEIKPQ